MTNNTRYYNGYSRVITVFINLTLSPGNGPSAQVWIGGVNLTAVDSKMTDYYYAAPGTPTAAMTLKAIVPNGYYFKVAIANSGNGINEATILY